MDKNLEAIFKNGNVDIWLAMVLSWLLKAKCYQAAAIRWFGSTTSNILPGLPLESAPSTLLQWYQFDCLPYCYPHTTHTLRTTMAQVSIYAHFAVRTDSTHWFSALPHHSIYLNRRSRNLDLHSL